jgi:hypothetical protein
VDDNDDDGDGGCGDDESTAFGTIEFMIQVF